MEFIIVEDVSTRREFVGDESDITNLLTTRWRRRGTAASPLTLDLLNKGDSVATSTSEKSWWARTFGRSVISMLAGTFFEKKTNAASIIAIILVLTICYVIVVKEKFEYMSFLLNIVFVVIGYYFGAKQESVTNGDE